MKTETADDRARNLMAEVMRCPMMWAATREGYVLIMATLLDVLGHDFKAIFEVVRMPGSPVLLDPREPLDDAWARRVNERVMAIIERGARQT